MQNHKNIVLCGFMGCGKSTVGRVLASKISYQFLDMDQYIEQQQGLSVSLIFKEQGEQAFRHMETQAACDFSAPQGVVIATGGGTLLNPKNAELLRRGGIIVLLDIPARIAFFRTKNDKDRPLLQRPDRKSFLFSLYQKRMPLYRRTADITVDADATPQIVAEQILQAVQPFMQEKT